MLKKWLKSIEKQAAAAKANGDGFGACLLPDPTGGPPICVQLDESTCKNLNGKFLGGDCISDVASSANKAKIKATARPRKKKARSKEE